MKQSWLPQTQTEAATQPHIADEVWQTIDDARRALAISALVPESDGSGDYLAEAILQETIIQSIADQEAHW